jgi:hypothetical protein
MVEELNHTDDAATQMAKMLEATNEVVRLTKELINIGTELNAVSGRYAEVKAKIRANKEIISSCKIAIKAESNSL